MGFGQGLSGLNAAAQNLDVIGNNIANSGTVGFKSGSATFADVYASSRVGLGVQVASINQRFTVGTISSTGNQFDMAIDGAKGLFRVQDPSGNILYTRNGQFFANKDNYIVNAQGQRLTGYGVNGTDLQPIMVPVGNIAPRATDVVTTKTNLDANAPAISPISLPVVDGTIVLAGGPAPGTYTYRVNADGEVVWNGTPPVDGAYTSADGSAVNIAALNPLPASALPAVGAGETAFANGTIILAGGPTPGTYTYRVNAGGEVVWNGTPPADGAYTSADGSAVAVDAATPLTAASLSPGVGENAYAAGTVVLAGGPTPGTYNYWVDAFGDIVWEGTPPGAGAYTSANGGAVTITAGAPLLAGALPPAGAGENAFAPAVIGHPFNPANPDSFTHSLPISVYDSLGNAHQLTQYFVKRESATPNESSWQVYYRLNGNPITSHPDTAPASLTFASNGLMLAGGTQTLNIANPGGTNSPADAISINLSYAGSTQFGGEFSPNFTQTGYPTGEYAGMSIATDGAIVANYTNGETQAMGYVALADFNNLQGLQPVGGNAWVETGASGGPVVGRPGSNGLATLQGQSVEESNVDMSQELVNMIIAQRTYQANAQTIKTQDQVLQTLITMR